MINIKELEEALNKTAKTLSYEITISENSDGNEYEISRTRLNSRFSDYRYITLYETQTLDEMVRKVRGKF